MTEGTGRKAGRAALLLFGRKAWGALLNLGVLTYLARVLPKEDFGIVAISGVFLGFISALVISGVGEYLIFYNGKDSKEVIIASFWMNAFASLLVALVAVLSAPYWAEYYSDDRITNIIYLMVLAFLGSMWGVVPRAVFRKTLNYQPVVIAETFKATLNGLGSLVLAFKGYGIYSLVLPNIISSTLSSFYLYRKCPVNPQFNFYLQRWPGIYKYSRNIIGTRIMGRLANEGDTLIVGKMLGLEALGVYSLAFRLANILNAQVLPVITSISFPILVDSRGDINLMKERFLKMISIITFIIIPIGGAMVVFAEPIIYLLYSAKWADVVLPFQIFIVFALFRAVSSPSSGIYNASGRPDLGLKFTLVFVPVLLIGIYISGTYGLLTVVITVTLLRIAGGIVNTKLALGLINLPLFRVYQQIYPVVLSTLLISFGAYGLVVLIKPHDTVWLFPGSFYLTLTLIVSRMIFTTNRYLISAVENFGPFLKHFVYKVYFIK